MHNLTKLFGIIGMSAVAVIGIATDYNFQNLLMLEGILGAAFGISIKYQTKV